MPARVIVVLVDGRVLDVSGLTSDQVVELLKAQGIHGSEIDHIKQGPMQPGERLPFAPALRDVRGWLGGYATPEQRQETLADYEAFYDATGRNGIDHWAEYLAWKARKLGRI